MDYQAINDDGVKPSRKYKILTIVFFVLFVGSIVAVSILAYELTKKSPKTNEPTVPYDHSDDFPITEPTSWEIGKDHDREFVYTFTEGTWMSLDLSPDGKNVVFDLLGDLYTIPYPEGGKASVFKDGVSFDIQPAYSPSGKKVLFTSDGGGCDNIWYREVDSGKEVQITFEPYHWVSSAKWIDEDTIVAVKWYTSTRSLGGGELWKYSLVDSDATENPGEKLVGRSGPAVQIGPEEPTVHDKYIYYSKNTRDSTVFNYGKDPYSGIYSVFRFNIETGENTRIAGGMGGATRPIISRKGDKIAFVRRYYLGTSLIIQDLETGNEKIVYEKLDFDQQESAAPSGTYPSFAFTPDDKKVVIWAMGKIITIELESGESTNVPFEVESKLKLSKTVRFEQEVLDKENPFEFKTKVATRPHSDDESKTVVFNSVGRTYVAKSSEEPKIVPVDSEKLMQFTPSLSKDGDYLVHIVWDDHDLAKIEIVKTNDLSERVTIDLPPGRYANPFFSPNFDSIVYQRLPGDNQSGYLHSKNYGVYVVSFKKDGDKFKFETPKLVTSSGHFATFNENGSTVFVSMGGYPLQVHEYGVSDSNFGQHLEHLAESMYATEISVSPNKKYVAFTEFRRVYLQEFVSQKPMNASARADIQTNAKSTQILSRRGGESITWSTDSSSIRFGWGSIFYRAPVFSFATCKDHKCIASDMKKTDLSVTASTGVSDSVLYFFNTTILTMNDENEIIEDGAIVVKDGRIEDIGKAGDVEKPTGAIEVNLNGDFILPGFIDAHAHWDGSWSSDYKVKASWEFYANLAYGVTTVHNPSADTNSIFADAELIKAGIKLGPRIFSTGEILYGGGGSHHCDIGSIEDATDYVAMLKDIGAISVKSYNQPCRHARLKLVKAARDLSINIVPEGGMAFYWNLNQIIDGHTTIEHSLPMAPLYKDVVTLFAESGTAWTPTLIVSYGGIMGEEYWFQNEDVWLDERANRFIPHSILKPRSIRRFALHDDDYHHFNISREVKAVNDMGGLVNAGAHGQMQGIGYHWEMRMFEQGGMEVMNVIRAATVNPAKSLGMFSDIGSLEVGKLADMITYDTSLDIINSVSALREVKHVIMNGRVYDALTMDQLYPTRQNADKMPLMNTPTVFN